MIINIMTKHAYLPTTIISDKGTAFTSKVTKEVTEVLGINLKHATTKHAQTIGMLERTHDSLKKMLKIETGERRSMWHKYVHIAVLNHNTSYHSSIGCEPSRVFHGRVPYNVLDLKLGIRPQRTSEPDSEVAQDVLKQTEIIHEDVRQNVMQAYLKYKAYYDKRANASVLKEKEYVYILQPKANNQGSKIPFTEFRWVGPYIVERVLPNNNYVVRKVGTHKTQTLHRMRIRPFQPREPIPDIQTTPKYWRPDPDVETTNEDLYARAWETDFGTPIFDEDNENFTQKKQTDVEVGQTEDQDHSSHTPGTNPRGGLENSGSVPEISGRNQDNASTTNEDVLERSGPNEDTPRTDDRSVLERSGQNEESSFSADKGVLECSGPNEEPSQSNKEGVLESSGHNEEPSQD